MMETIVLNPPNRPPTRAELDALPPPDESTRVDLPPPGPDHVNEES